jgi:hypothetical protein
LFILFFQSSYFYLVCVRLSYAWICSSPDPAIVGLQLADFKNSVCFLFVCFLISFFYFSEQMLRVYSWKVS